jgi:hypothetical protein
MTAATKFTGLVRYVRPQLHSGLAVVDIPKDVAERIGGLKQMKVRGRLNGVEFNSNTMPAGGGVLALSLSRALLKSASLEVGQKANVEIYRP